MHNNAPVYPRFCRLQLRDDAGRRLESRVLCLQSPTRRHDMIYTKRHLPYHRLSSSGVGYIQRAAIFSMPMAYKSDLNFWRGKNAEEHLHL